MTDIEKSPEDLTTCEIIKEEAVKLKWRVLIACCFVTFGSYYIYDFPGAIGTGPTHTIQAKFYDHNKEYTQEMNQVLYSVYSWPNTILAMFGGLLIDKFLGLRRAMILFTILVFSGAALFYVGVVSMNYPVMVVARILFGLGGESLSVAQSAFVARWFKGGRGMALAFGITISFSRVGSSFNFLFSPMIATHHGINTAVMFGMFACLLSLCCCFILIACDIYGTKHGLVPPEAKDDAEPFHPRDILKLPTTLWIISVICVFCYTAIFPFIGIAKNYFEQKFGMSGDEASEYVSLYQFTSAGGSPIVGSLVDHTNRNTYWLILASTLFVLTHVVMLLSRVPPAVMMSLMGIFYSFLVSGLWPAVPYAVDESVVGFAYGVMTAMQNAGLATFPIITGAILDKYTPANAPGVNASDHYFFAPEDNLLGATVPPSKKAPLPTAEGFRYTEILFICSAGVSLAASFLLLIVDKRGNGILSAAPEERKRIREEQLALLNDTEDV